jgi:hypothetical protein
VEILLIFIQDFLKMYCLKGHLHTSFKLTDFSNLLFKKKSQQIEIWKNLIWLSQIKGFTFLYHYGLNCVLKFMLKSWLLLAQNVTAFGDRSLGGNKVKMKSLSWSLISYDWCSYKIRLEYRPAQQKNHGKTKRKNIMYSQGKRFQNDTNPADILILDL